MIRAVLCSAMLWLTVFGSASADGFPAAYSVRDVAQHDTLNIRAAPSASAAAVGAIAPFSVNVEVIEVSADEKWGKVGIPEGNGWVNMRYLEATSPADPSELPRPFSCFGTEPFWNIGMYPRGSEYTSPDTGAVPLTDVSALVAPEGYLIKLVEGPSLTRTLIVTRETCSDGMSDRVFGFAARMFIEAPDGNAAYSACCTLDHR